MPHGDLENDVDRALKRLPGPRAPRTLVPRVMAAVEAEMARPARARPWLSWPVGWQAASLAAVVVFGLGIVQLWPGTGAVVEQSTPTILAEVITFVVDAASKASVVVNVTQVVWRTLVQPVLGYVLVLLLVMCAACLTFGAALGRVALREVSQT